MSDEAPSRYPTRQVLVLAQMMNLPPDSDGDVRVIIPHGPLPNGSNHAYHPERGSVRFISPASVVEWDAIVEGMAEALALRADLTMDQARPLAASLLESGVMKARPDAR